MWRSAFTLTKRTCYNPALLFLCVPSHGTFVLSFFCAVCWNCEIKRVVSSSGVWGLGLATRRADMNQIPLGNDTESWVLRHDGILSHNNSECGKLVDAPQEGDIVVSVLCSMKKRGRGVVPNSHATIPEHHTHHLPWTATHCTFDPATTSWLRSPCSVPNCN